MHRHPVSGIKRLNRPGLRAQHFSSSSSSRNICQPCTHFHPRGVQAQFRLVSALDGQFQRVMGRRGWMVSRVEFEVCHYQKAMFSGPNPQKGASKQARSASSSYMRHHGHGSRSEHPKGGFTSRYPAMLALMRLLYPASESAGMTLSTSKIRVRDRYCVCHSPPGWLPSRRSMR